jgi:predicted MFS family arabinose efflux permease
MRVYDAPMPTAKPLTRGRAPRRDEPRAVSRDVNLLVGAQAISSFGSFITRSALPLLAILGLGVTPIEAALLAAVDLLAAALISQFAGVWIDRLPRRPLLITADLARAALLGSIPASALLFGGVALPHLIFVSAASGACTTAFDIAERSYLVGLVPAPQLRRILARLLGIRGAAEFFGFGVAGLLVARIGGPAAIGVDALTYVASAALLTLLRVREPALPPTSARKSVRYEVIDGLRRTWAEQPLRPLLFSGAVIGLYFGLFRSSYMLFLTRGLGLGPEAIGAIAAVGGIAAFSGGILTERFSRWLGLGRSLAVSYALVGAGLLLVPLSPGPTLLGFAMLIGHQLLSDGFETVWEANQATIRARLIPDAYQGRSNAAFEGVGILARLAGIAVGGLIGSSASGSGASLVVGGAAAVLVGIYLGISPLGRLRTIADLNATRPRSS